MDQPVNDEQDGERSDHTVTLLRNGWTGPLCLPFEPSKGKATDQRAAAVRRRRGQYPRNRGRPIVSLAVARVSIREIAVPSPMASAWSARLAMRASAPRAAGVQKRQGPAARISTLRIADEPVSAPNGARNIRQAVPDSRQIGCLPAAAATDP